jgi:predicted RNA-binding protein (virulence factor B family)
MGQRLTGYIRSVRSDGKIDLGLDPVGYRRVASYTDDIIQALQKAGGRMPYHDDSSPEAIRAAFGMSKKAFKQAIGSLFKARRILITKDGIRLADAKN